MKVVVMSRSGLYADPQGQYLDQKKMRQGRTEHSPPPSFPEAHTFSMWPYSFPPPGIGNRLGHYPLTVQSQLPPYHGFGTALCLYILLITDPGSIYHISPAGFLDSLKRAYLWPMYHLGLGLGLDLDMCSTSDWAQSLVPILDYHLQQ